MGNYGKILDYLLHVADVVAVRKLILLAILLLLCTHSWGACSPYTYTSYPGITASQCADRLNALGPSAGGIIVCANYLASNSGSGPGYCQVYGSDRTPSSSCGGMSNYDAYRCWTGCVKCATQAEADSVKCAQDPTAQGCGNCKAADSTWYNTAVDSCNAVYGENSYALVDTNDVCEHRGRCCPMDSVIAGNSCAYRCDSIADACASKKGRLAVDVLRDTSVTDSDSTFYNKCYYNCSYAYSVDSAEAIVLGNITLAGHSTAISDGTKSLADFASVRSDYSGVYVYDYLSPESYAWLDSLVSTPCATGMYRGIKNGKYVYWKAGQPVPDSVTNVVKIK